MPIITVAPVINDTDEILRTFTDSVGTSPVTYTYLVKQEKITVTNKGTSHLILTVGVMMYTIPPNRSQTVVTPFTEFIIYSTNGVQSFDAISDEVEYNTDSTQQEQEIFTKIKDHSNQLGNLLFSNWIDVKSPPAPLVAAKGDGTTDDTNMIIACLEYANSIAAGTWNTGGDTANGTSRKRVAVHFPPGKYRTTSTLKIRFENVSIVGAFNETDGGSDWGGYTSTILADHAGDVFQIDSTYNVYYTNFKYLAIRKTAAYQNQGHGISVIGANWLTGLMFSFVSIRGCNDGIHIGITSTTVAEVWVEHCALGVNNGYGFYCAPAITIGRIEKNNISQNNTGGIYTGLKGAAILDNDLEGQPNPLTIAGSNNQEFRIAGNYFEYNQSGTACINVSLGHGFRIERNQWGPNITIPQLSLTNCSDGYVDKYAILNSCHNVETEIGGQVPNSSSYYSQSLNLSCYNLPPNSSDQLPNVLVFGGGTNNITIGGRNYKADYINGTFRGLYTSGTFNFTANDYVGFAYAIKYTNTVPTIAQTQQVLVYGYNTGTSAWEQITTIGFTVSGTLIQGDTVAIIGGFQCPAGKTYSQIRLYVYPFNNDSTVGNGAYVTQIVAWKQSTATFNNVNPFVYLGSNSLYGNASLTFPSIAANSSAELTVTVTGATTADAAYASPTTSIEAGLLWSAYVGAANTVTIRMFNLTASPMTPAVKTWNVGVIQQRN